MPFISKGGLRARLDREFENGKFEGRGIALTAALATPSPRPTHLDALDLVIDAFGLRGQYGNTHTKSDLRVGEFSRSNVDVIESRGAQRFYDDLVAAKEFSAKHDAFHRIQAATLTDAAIDAALDMIAATEEETE